MRSPVPWRQASGALLDEPLGSLDRPLRRRLLVDLEELFDRLGLTVLHVTHDVGEAFALGDRVAVMRAGRIIQAAAPDELWARPADAWVARFLGLANVQERDDPGKRDPADRLRSPRRRRDGHGSRTAARWYGSGSAG